MDVSILNTHSELVQTNEDINSEVQWVSEMSNYKTEELEGLNVGDFNMKLIYFANKSFREQEAMDKLKNGGNDIVGYSEWKEENLK